MPDRIFLVHGMGNYPDGWAKPWVDGLRSLYQSYDPLARTPFAERFKVVPIGYDEIFRTIVQRWQQDATSIGAAAPSVGAARVEALVGWLRTAAVVDDNFAWTHCADVLLYYLFPAVRDAVRVHVAKQVATEVATLKADESWSVLAHSLGTAVSHDALHLLWSGTFPDGQPTGFNAKDDKALLVAMIANVSRVLEDQPDVYESTVMPGPARATDRGCFYYLNARHVLDPFTIPRAFDPAAWPDAKSVAQGLYRRVLVEHIQDWNVHDFLHYLRNPRVHIPLFRTLTYDRAIPAAQEAAALAKFKPFGRLTTDQAVAIKTWLEKRAPAFSDTWDVLRVVWDWYYAGPAAAPAGVVAATPAGGPGD